MKKMKNTVYIILLSVLAFGITSCNNNCCDKTNEKSTTEEKSCCEKENTEAAENEVKREVMTITKVSDVKIAETPHKVDVRKIYDQSCAQLMHITLQPGETLKQHITPVDAIFYILEGTVDVMVGEETESVDADCIVDSPKDIKHCISNNSDKLARILVIKAPRQTTSSTIL